jgi:hypothetical protein
MRVDRIAAFAEAMVPSLAGMAGETIHKLGKVEPKRRQIVIDSVFALSKHRHRETAQRLLAEAFPPSDPLSGEAAAIAVLLIHSAFCAAMEFALIWDRRLSAKSIAAHIEIGMNEHIDNFAKDRGMRRDLAEPIDIGFEGITLEVTRR